MNLIVYFLGLLGSVGSLLYSFSFSGQVNIVMIVTIFTGMGIYLGYHHTLNRKRFVKVIWLIEGVLLLLPTTISGLLYCLTVVLHKYRDVSVYSFNFESGQIFYDQVFTCVIVFLVIFIPLAMLTTIALHKKKYALALVALLPGVFVELLFTITPPGFYLASYLLFALVMIMGALQKQPTIKITMILLCLFTMVITYVSFGVDTYRPSKISLFSKTKTPLTTAGSMKEDYSIKDQGNRIYRNSLDFVIDGAELLGNFKIRGLAYNVYRDDSWEIKNDNFNDDAWILRNLSKIQEITQAGTQIVTINQLSGYSQRNYTPYYFMNNDLHSYNSYYQGINPQSYTMIVPNDDFNRVLNAVGKDAKYAILQEVAAKNKIELKNIETYYYGNDAYLKEVPKTEKKIIEQFLTSNNITYNGDLYAYIDSCKQALATQTSYTLSPGSCPDDENSLNYFLNVNKKGYCIHYASALALMLRYNGIASRYVHGYQASGNRNKDNQLIIRDNQEHAWVEIYDAYFGWIPIEAIASNVANLDTPANTTPTAPVDNNQTSPITPTTPPTKPVKETKDSFVFPTYGYAIIAFVLIVGGVYLQAKIRKKKMFIKAKNNKQLVGYYYHYLKQLKIDGQGIKEVVDKARFSKATISDEELLLVQDFYYQHLREYYQTSNLLVKFYLRFILAYY